MLFDLIEKVIPATDQAILVPVVDQVKFKGHPGLTHLGGDRIQRTSETCTNTILNFKLYAGRACRACGKQSYLKRNLGRRGCT